MKIYNPLMVLEHTKNFEFYRENLIDFEYFTYYKNKDTPL